MDKVKVLQPVRDRLVYADLMEKRLAYDLWLALYKPLLEIFGLRSRQDAPGRANARSARSNAKEGLKEALEANKIVFVDGYFYGDFTAAISRQIRAMGGVFNKTKMAWKVDPTRIPTDIALVIAQKREESTAKIDRALKLIDQIQTDGLGPLNTAEVAEGIMGDLHRQFKLTAADKLEIPMTMSTQVAEKIKEDYTTNLNLYIKKWTDEATVRLRHQVQENAAIGYRARAMESGIMDEYGVSERKARFLARQETSLLVSKYREQSYKEAGVNYYKWSTSGDQRVRPDHKRLNNRIFSWDEPPIVDSATGRRAHPGEDFGCRCVAIPVIMNQIQIAEWNARHGKRG